MVNYISGLVFVVLAVLGALLLIPIVQADPAIGAIFILLWMLGDVILSSAIRIAAQWEKGVVFRLGKFSSIKGPGLFLIVPLIDQVRMVDTRVLAIDIPEQQVITKDNVTVQVDAVVYFQVINPEDAVLKMIYLKL